MVDIASISEGLRQEENGVWYTNAVQDISYPSDGNNACFSLEDDSFWFRHRNNCIQSVVSSYSPVEGGAIFDIGGGNGCVSIALAKSGFDVVLVEPGEDGALNAVNRGVKNVICATTETAGFISDSLPAIGLFDVVEHIDNDLVFLKSLRTFLQEKGRIYITVPAYPLLWSDVDVGAGHYRRYTMAAIRQVVEEAGYEVEYSTHIFRFLPLPIALFRALPFRLGLSRSGVKRQSADRVHATRDGIVSRTLEWVLNGELATLEKRGRMRFGGSCLLVAKAV